jgi:NAD(P)-dependent dehydrogenase (short-subunit alcohol dehydrogenase family)
MGRATPGPPRMFDKPDFSGKAVLITGAAAGLGRATAILFAELGANLCLVDINAGGLNETARLASRSGQAVDAQPVDISQPAACEAVVKGAAARFGRLDGLCNIAGVLDFSHFTELSPERLRRVMSVNFEAPFLLAQAAIPYLLASNGAIVNVASSAAFIGESYLAAYAASKAAIVSLTKSLAIEFAKQPLRVSAVAPGSMETSMASAVVLPSNADFTLIQRYSGLRGHVSVADVAAMIVQLASERGAAFHGNCVMMDAGITVG